MSFLLKHDKKEKDRKSITSSTASVTDEGAANVKPVESTTQALPTASSSVIKFYPNWCTCFDHTLNYTRPEHGTCKENLRFFFRCPPGGPIAKILVFLFIFTLTWTILWLLVGDVAGLRGPIMAIFVLEIIGLFLGLLIKAIGFPALLAPLALGILLRNVDVLDIFLYFQYPYHTKRHFNNTGDLLPYCTSVLFYNFTVDKAHDAKCCNHWKLLASSGWIRPIRQIALTLILTRAGLELSPKQLKKLKGVVPALAFIPCCVEAATCGALFYWLFNELTPSIWMCAVAGFALSAVSPAVVVPGVLSLSRKGYGVAKGIPTLLIAASSIDDVLAITLYTIALSLSTSGKASKLELCINPFVETETRHEYSSYVQIAASVSAIVLGILVGITVGCILHFVPSPESRSKGMQRLVLLLVFNITCMLGFERSEILSGAGSIGVLTTSFIASFGWRSQRNWKPAMHEVEHKLAHIWAIFVPILFGTIGKEIKFAAEDALHDPYNVEPLSKEDVILKDKYWNPLSRYNIGRIIGIILICLVVRCFTTGLIATAAKLNWKERIFVALAWIPKATVQAALAPLVLSEIVDKEHTVRMTCLAKAIVSMAVFAIIITAPVGALCITFTGPYLLTKINKADIEEEFPNGDDSSLHGEESVNLFKASETRLKRISSSNESFDDANASRGSVASLPKNMEASNASLKGVDSVESGSGTVLLDSKLKQAPPGAAADFKPKQAPAAPP